MDDEITLAQLRRAGGRIERPGLVLQLAEAFGFCQGVERAVARALAAVAASPARASDPAPRLWLTGEIIHNPAINDRLRARGVARLPEPGVPDRLAAITPADRVIIPAFGIEIEEERELERIGCEVIDTTCGWVRRVWKAAAEFAAAGLTLVIHGKREHEETRATASRVPGPWIVVRDRRSAGRLAESIADPAIALAPVLRAGASPGFDAARDLERLGLVNQTTMLSQETEQIAELLRAALAHRRGQTPGRSHFRMLDTFCPATQKRQDAVRALLADFRPDLLIVIGGFRSSNTAHLARLGHDETRTYHVESADDLLSAERIRHLPPGATDPRIETGWLPRAPQRIGLSAGASTPNDETQRLIRRLLAFSQAAPQSASAGGER